MQNDINNSVRMGEVLNLKITAENPHGEGIAKKDEFVIFVKGAKSGQVCKVKIKEIKRTYAIAERV